MTLTIAERWFETKRIDDSITLLWEPHVIPLMRCNIWHVRGRDRDLVIDTGMGIVSLREAMAPLLDKAVTAVATHTHADHIGSHHEFEDCAAHRLEAPWLERPTPETHLVVMDRSGNPGAGMSIAGYEIGDSLITALPHAGYSLTSYAIRPARVTRRLEEGSVIDLGDRHFEVVHLPGHSPGSIGLFEAATGVFFSGDAIYDGELIDELGHSDIDDYIATMERLKRLPVTVVHGGHCPSFGRDRLIELADAYLTAKRPG
jgi:glyoxylase-like metal-dependent hydrolase (beta-lactamase superfamily II)